MVFKNNLMDPVMWLCGQKYLSLNQVTWVQSLESTQWKEKTDFCRLSFAPTSVQWPMCPSTINKWNVKNKPFDLARLSWCWVTRIFTERKTFWVANVLYSGCIFIVFFILLHGLKKYHPFWYPYSSKIGKRHKEQIGETINTDGGQVRG